MESLVASWNSNSQLVHALAATFRHSVSNRLLCSRMHYLILFAAYTEDSPVSGRFAPSGRFDHISKRFDPISGTPPPLRERGGGSSSLPPARLTTENLEKSLFFLDLVPNGVPHRIPEVETLLHTQFAAHRPNSPYFSAIFPPPSTRSI